MDKKCESKKVYVKPVVEDHGSVIDLTSVGNTNPGNDCKYGSVNPPGLECKD